MPTPSPVASSEVQLQKALFTLFTTDSGVVALLPKVVVDGDLVVPLFDLVPREIIDLFGVGNGPTYVTFGQGTVDVTLHDTDADDEDAEELEETEHTLGIQVFSQKVGFVDCKNVLDAFHNAVRKMRRRIADGDPTIMPDYQLKLLDPVSKEFRRADDGFTPTGVLTLRALTLPKTP